MTREETLEALEKLKKEGFTEDEMLITFYTMFQNDKLSLQELESIIGLLGYTLKPEFLAMSPEEQKKKGYIDEIEEDSDVEDLVDKLKNSIKPHKECVYISHEELGKLRQIVINKGISLTNMAEVLNVTKTTLYSILLGEKELTYNMYMKISYGFNDYSWKNFDFNGITILDIQSVIQEFKKKGYSNDEINLFFYKQLCEDEISLPVFTCINNLLGYDIPRYFFDMTSEEQKKFYKDIKEK